MKHSYKQVLRKARCLAKMVLRLKKEGKHNCHELDDMAQEAQYIKLDTDHLDKQK